MISAYQLVKWWKNKNRLGVGFLGTSLVFLIVQYFVLSFHLLPTYQRAWNLGPLGWIDYVNTGNIVVNHPQPNNAPNEEILLKLVNLQRNQPASIMVGIDRANINPSTLDLVITLKNYWQLSLEAPYNIIEFTSDTEIQRYLERFHYVILPEGEVGPDAVRHKKALEQIKNYILVKHPEKYNVVQYFELEEAEKVILLRKI